MKSLKYMGFALAAASCMQFAAAQQPAKLSAYVQVPGGNPALLELERSDGNGSFFYLQKGTDQLMQTKASACKLFYIQTPAEMANALRDYYGGDYADARKQFASIKKKYASFAGLPGSPCTLSALYELTCAVRMLDVAAAKTLVDSFPGASALTGADAARLEAAKVFALIDDKPESFATIKAGVEEIVKTHGRNLDSESNGWLRYALARAAASMVPAEQVQATIAEDKVKAASAAVDFYCQAVMSMHGAQKTLPMDALNRAMTMLWAMPGVQDYAAKVGSPITKPGWNAAPADFRDAVAMAHYLKTIYPSETPNALADKLDAYYFNAKKGVKKGE